VPIHGDTQIDLKTEMRGVVKVRSKKRRKQKTQEKKKCLSVPIHRDTKIDVKTDCDQGKQQQQKQNGKPIKTGTRLEAKERLEQLKGRCC
jgi:UDP-N-acetylglucosamine 2-epimerase